MTETNHARLSDLIIGHPEVTSFTGLEKLVAHFEAPRTQPWELRLEPAKLDALLGAIVAFEMRVERVEAKLKLGQNRSAQDRQGAIAGLAQEAGEPELIALMRRFAG